MASREDKAGVHKHARSGRENGLAREQVADIQRARILAAMYEAACEHGGANVTVSHVVERAGISRRTFYELFSDREDCFLAAFDEAVQRIATGVVSAWNATGSWRERLRSSLVELLSSLDDDPVSGRLVVVEALGAGHRALQRRENVLAQVIAAVDEGRDEARTGREPTPLTAEGVVGAAFSVIHARMLAAERTSLLALTGPLTSMLVLPYLGSAAARRELDRPAPTPSTNVRRPAGDPLRRLGMRLTYRTVRVLLAVAQTPGASNRTLAEASGISDQGQISKLLGRLTALGLIENAGPGLVRGEPNAWRLTPKGRSLEQAIGPRP